MPKKFKEVNTKAAAAKERKAAVKREEDERKRQAEEDEYWRDDDKSASKKQERKMAQERKRQEQQQRKLEGKKLLEEEEIAIGGKSSATGGGKVTRAQIAHHEEQQRRADEGATPLPKGVVEVDHLVENPNLLLRQRAEEGHLDAETIDEAIAVLRVGEEPPVKEKHPERRMKAAYATFEERELPRVRAENPNMRMSQLKQVLRKEWMRSPENPMNQVHMRYNEKS